MTTATHSKPAAKTAVYTIARIQFKSDARKVVYLVRSSDGITQYQTCLYNGYATSCDCASRKPCKHMVHAQACEQERTRVQALSQARQESAAMLAQIDSEVMAHIASECAQAVTEPRVKSEQYRIADVRDQTEARRACERVTAELVLLQAGMRAQEQQSDPWKGLNHEQRRAAYREFEYFYS